MLTTCVCTLRGKTHAYRWYWSLTKCVRFLQHFVWLGRSSTYMFALANCMPCYATLECKFCYTEEIRWRYWNLHWSSHSCPALFNYCWLRPNHEPLICDSYLKIMQRSKRPYHDKFTSLFYTRSVMWALSKINTMQIANRDLLIGSCVVVWIFSLQM